MTDFPIDALQAVSRDDTQPAYAQIAEQLRRVILDKKVTPGTQLPSETELVQRFRVSRMTVREGIRVLRQNNTLRAHQGVGVFVGDRGQDENQPPNPETNHSHVMESEEQPMLRAVDIEIPEGQDLLAVATIALDRDGQYKLSIRNVVDAPLTLTPVEQADALRLLATGVEAEAVGREERL